MNFPMEIKRNRSLQSFNPPRIGFTDDAAAQTDNAGLSHSYAEMISPSAAGLLSHRGRMQNICQPLLIFGGTGSSCGYREGKQTRSLTIALAANLSRQRLQEVRTAQRTPLDGETKRAPFTSRQLAGWRKPHFRAKACLGAPYRQKIPCPGRGLLQTQVIASQKIENICLARFER